MWSFSSIFIICDKLQSSSKAYLPKTRTFTEAFKCFVGSISALQWYTPISSMVMFGKTKALLITTTAAGLSLVLFMWCWFSWRQRKFREIHYNLWGSLVTCSSVNSKSSSYLLPWKIPRKVNSSIIGGLTSAVEVEGVSNQHSDPIRGDLHIIKNMCCKIETDIRILKCSRNIKINTLFTIQAWTERQQTHYIW